MHNETTLSRVPCLQCEKMILEDTSNRNDGLCGICNNWEYPQSKRNVLKVKRARKDVKCFYVLIIIFLSIVCTLIGLGIVYVGWPTSLVKVLIWMVAVLFAFPLTKGAIYLVRRMYTIRKSSDEEVFKGLKEDYLKRVSRDIKRRKYKDSQQKDTAD